tara:strand:- start:393 stop:896 length:504 start_codon:yes stop_codon:yes gene_type:complete
MSKLNFLFFFLLFIYNISPVYSSEKVAFINLDLLIQKSEIGKLTLKNISDMDKKNINFLENKNKELKDLETQIKNKKNVISKQAFEKEVELIRKKINDFRFKKNDLVKDFEKFKKNEISKFFQKISPTINEYMRENSITILLDTKNIFIGDAKSDITDIILKEINKL